MHDVPMTMTGCVLLLLGGWCLQEHEIYSIYYARPAHRFRLRTSDNVTWCLFSVMNARLSDHGQRCEKRTRRVYLYGCSRR